MRVFLSSTAFSCENTVVLDRIMTNLSAHFRIQSHLKVKTSIGNAPISKNEMEALITNHVKEYVLTNT
jgi:hypothetical protein